MLILLVCTEGEVSEPAYIEALKSQLGGQMPRGKTSQVEILPIPLGGNHGHKKLIERAQKAINDAIKDQDSILYIANEIDEDVTIERWLICDYDEMDNRRIDIKQLRRQARQEGFNLVVSKPRFEVFVLLHFLDIDEVAKIDPSNLNGAINREVEKLNKLNVKTKANVSEVILIPKKYGKKKYQAQTFFGKMLNLNPELIDKALQHSPDYRSHYFSDMPELIKRIRSVLTEKD